MPDESGNSPARIVLGVVAAVIGAVLTSFLLRAVASVPTVVIFALTVLASAGIGYLVVHLQVKRELGRAERVARYSGNEVIQAVMMVDVERIRRELRREPLKAALLGGAFAIPISYLVTITVLSPMSVSPL